MLKTYLETVRKEEISLELYGISCRRYHTCTDYTCLYIH